MLRWWTPVMIFRRTVTENTLFANREMQRGDKIIVSFSAANRDPAVFENPHEFDIERDPNPHVAFGYGPHFCLGAQLARIQMKTIFCELLTRLKNIRADGEATYLRSNFQRGVKNLPIKFDKR
jgi:cytochrome P450